MVAYDPFDPDTIANPYPTFAALRDESPVHHIEALGVWAVSRYDDVIRVLREPQVFSSAEGMRDLFELAGGGEMSVIRGQGRNLIATDPPVHTAMRRVVNRGFTPQVIRSWEERVRWFADDLVSDLLRRAEGGPVDLVRELTYPLPVTVIAEMLGIETERRDDFKAWSDALVSGLSATGDGPAIAEASHALRAYFQQVVGKRLDDPKDDLISMLVTRGRSGEAALTFEELVAFAILLLIAGNETTTNLLGNWMRAMFDRPDVIAALRADPALIPAAIEETLRYDSPVQMLFRGTTQAVRLGDTEIPAGARVAVLFGSANRDERKWGPDADVLRVDRNPADHVAFGHGIHLCLGAPLARLEARVAIETLLARTRSIEPAGSIEATTGFLLRGCTSIPVEVTPV